MSVDGRCEVVQACGEGESRDGGACVENPVGPEGDAGDGDGEQDGSVPGDHDAMVTESVDPALCAPLDCGAFGECRVVDGNAECACDDGVTGELCDACEEGLVFDNDACVPPCEAQDAPDCGEHGACEGADGAAACACEHPYVGDSCSECAEGFALESDGTCVPDCGECGEHAFCNEALMTPSCECVAGYADQVGGCAWAGDGETGGVVDGDLADPDAWTSELVSIAGGRATFENERSDAEGCSVGSLHQTITMPAREDAEQLVMEVDLVSKCTATAEEDCPALQLEIGSSINRLTVVGPANNTVTVPVCLGDAAYGGDIPIAIRPGLAFRFGTDAFECDEGNWPQVERVRIRPAEAAECPEPGTALGSLSSSNGWANSAGSTFSAGQISVGSTLNTLVHVPAGSGLAVMANGTSTMLTVEGLDQTYLLMGATAQCLPSWAGGGVTRVGFRALYAGAKVTAFSIVANASCGGSEFDRSFERDAVGANRSWDAYPRDALAVPSVAAFDGTKVLRAAPASAESTGASVDAVALVQMPMLDDSGAGLAMTARRRLVAPASATVTGSYTINFGLSRTFAVTSTSWTSVELICLDPEWAGQLASIHLHATSTRTAGTGKPELLLDDVGPALKDSCD